MEALDWTRVAENSKWRRGSMWKSRYKALVMEDGPSRLRSHRDLADDTMGLIAYFYVLKSPKFYLPAFFAMRMTLFVALPLMILAGFQEVFPAYIALGLIGIMDCRETVGEQIAQFILSTQVNLWMTVWGLLLYYVDVLYYPISWWCTLFFNVLLLSLLGDVRCKSQLILGTVLIMEMERLNVTQDPLFALKIGRDFMMCSAFALLQVFVWPFTMTSRVDEGLRAAWKDVGRVVRSTAVACWSHDSVEVMLALSRTSTEPLYKAFVKESAQMVAVMYEPWESTLRLQLRKERLETVRHLMPYLHGMAASVRSLHLHQRPQQAQKTDVRYEAFKSPYDGPGLPDPSTVVQNTAKRLHDYLYDPLQAFLEALDAVLNGLGDHLNPREVAEKVPFDDLHKATSQLQSAIDKLHFDTTMCGTSQVESVEYISVVFSHLTMVLLAEEILKYGELMRNFDRSRYKSTSRRIVEFCFLDYWNDFWSELPNRLTLATPRDVRLLKDAFKVSLAYTIGVMYTLYIDPVNVFYFGMAILIGVSFPTAGESLMSGVQRVAGVAFAISVAFVATNRFHTRASQFAVALSGIFLLLYTRSFPQYMQVSSYGAAIIIPSMYLVSTPLTALSRVVINCFTVMTYYAIVVLIFPIDTIKVLHNMEVQAIEAISDSFSDLITLVLVPVEADNERVQSCLSDLDRRRCALWGSVSEVPLWIPRAASEPIIRGIPYPVSAQEQFMPVLRRLAASMDIIRVGLLRIHRSRVDSSEADAKKVLLSVAPLIRCIDKYRCHIMQDFIDAVQEPMSWSAEHAAGHFSSMLQLNLELEEAFASAHAGIISAIQMEFQKRLLRRATAFQATMADPFDVSTNQVFSVGESFRLQEGDLTALIPNASDDNASFHHTVASIRSIEREELTGLRNASFMLRPEEFTINHDMNMSIAILVGIDMFCNELDKMLSVMFQLNQFERSRRM